MSDEINATDAALKLAEEQGLDLADVLGTGVEGRVTKGDVEAHLAALESKPEEPEVEPVGGVFTTAGGAQAAPVIAVDMAFFDGPVTITNLSAEERAHALAADVTAYMRPDEDPVLAIIAALPPAQLLCLAHDGEVRLRMWRRRPVDDTARSRFTDTDVFDGIVAMRTAADRRGGWW